MEIQLGEISKLTYRLSLRIHSRSAQPVTQSKPPPEYTYRLHTPIGQCSCTPDGAGKYTFYISPAHPRVNTTPDARKHSRGGVATYVLRQLACAGSTPLAGGSELQTGGCECWTAERTKDGVTYILPLSAPKPSAKTPEYLPTAQENCQQRTTSERANGQGLPTGSSAVRPRSISLE